VNKCSSVVVGVDDLPLSALIQAAVRHIAELL